LYRQGEAQKEMRRRRRSGGASYEWWEETHPLDPIADESALK
jgi:hypothetical protein